MLIKNEFGVPTVIEGFLGVTEVPGALSGPFDGSHKLDEIAVGIEFVWGRASIGNSEGSGVGGSRG